MVRARLVRTAWVSLWLLAAAPGWAQYGAEPQGPDYARDGVWIRGGYAGAAENSGDLDSAAATLGGTQESDVGNGFAAGAGVRLLPHLGFEVAFQYFSDARVTLVDSSVGTQPAATRRTFDLTANLRGYPLTGRFQPYAAFGLGMANVRYTPTPNVQAFVNQTDTGNGLVVRFGGGLEYYLSERHALYADGAYMLTTGAIDGNDYGTFGLGVMTRF